MEEIKKYEKNLINIPKYNNIEEQFEEALKVVDDIVLKNYLTNLKNLEVLPLSQKEQENNLTFSALLFSCSF